MSIKEIEKNVVKLASEVKEDTVICRVDTVKTRYDKYMRKVVQIYAYCDTYGTVVFNYSPQKARMLVEAFKKMGIEDYIVGRCFEFKKVKVDKMREDYTDPYPMFTPVKIIDCNYISSE